MTFSNRLLSERKRLKKNQTEFAQQAGTTKKSQIDYENDRVPAFANYLAAIAQAGVDVQYLLTGIRAAEPVLTPEEKSLLDCWRAASPALRGAALAVLVSGAAGCGPVVHGNVNGGIISSGKISIRKG